MKFSKDPSKNKQMDHWENGVGCDKKTKNADKFQIG